VTTTRPISLSDLLVDVEGARISGDAEVEIAEVRDDSRQVERGDLFVALAGNAADGRRFLSDAVARGARAVLVEAGGAGAATTGETTLALAASHGVTAVVVDDARLALARIAARRWSTGQELILSAVTGTNGKTTTTYLFESMLGAAGILCGVIGTVAYRVGGGNRRAGAESAEGSGPLLVRDAPLTTPGALALHRLLGDMRATGATDVVLEASSHALDQRRLDGCRFRVAALTNLTQDHLDYHGTMERYLDAKGLLFERLLDPTAGVAVLPVDSPAGRTLRSRLRAGQPRLGVALSVASSVAAGSGADVVVESASQSASGLRARLGTPLGPIELVSSLVGDFNLANIVVAVGMAIARGLSPDDIVRGVRALDGVPGRLQRVDNSRGVLAVVDYAHTPDAVERAIAAVRPLVGTGGCLITVLGCGGDRDRSKRPRMGRAAMEGSDLVVVTSDNPRSEDPLAIIDAIVEGGTDRVGTALSAEHLADGGGRGFLAEPDRRTAIRLAVAASRPGDVLLIAGKGHETYQIVGSTRLHFDDVEEVRLAFAAQSSPAPSKRASLDEGAGPTMMMMTTTTPAPRLGSGAAAAAATPPGHRAAAERPLSFAIAAMAGRAAGPGQPGSSLGTFRGAATDSRSVQAGQLFFALPGARVDGFHYAAEAEARGAAAVVVDARRGLPTGVTVPVIEVADPLSALGDLARAVRAELTGRVVAITGSNGKTTTKELCASALGAAGRVLRTAGSLNTEVGLPLTILSAVGDEAFWVLEMAMRGRHQIELLADIARPHVGVITNVGAAHLELLGSLEEVARAKGELFAKLGPEGIAVLPAADPLIEAQAAHLPESRKIRFDGGGLDARGQTAVDVAVDVAILEARPDGPAGQVVRYRVGRETVVAHLPFAGIHNARNGAAALGVALALGVSPAAAAAALSGTVLPPHRSLPRPVGGRVVLDDCYNANPASMRAALEMVVAATARPAGAFPGDADTPAGPAPRAFAVLGDMLETGPDEVELHRALGREAGRVLAGLGVVGELARHIAVGAEEVGMSPARIVVGQDPATVAAAVGAWTRPGDVILVKASRGARLERAVDALLEQLGETPHG
jgi:murE/murF fusion protein